MHVEILVEEPSAEAALHHLVPRLMPDVASWEVRPFTGKPALLKELPTRLRAYPEWLPHTYGPAWCVVVLVDRDEDDCVVLKSTLERIAADAGLTSRSVARASGGVEYAPGGVGYDVVNRIVVEELEAWFFGDVSALRAAYPSVSESLGSKAKYRDPDAIRGGTWEQLEKELGRAYPAGMPKVEVASRVAPHLNPEANRSRSFGAFRDALVEINAWAAGVLAGS